MRDQRFMMVDGYMVQKSLVVASLDRLVVKKPTKSYDIFLFQIFQMVVGFLKLPNLEAGFVWKYRKDRKWKNLHGCASDS